MDYEENKIHSCVELVFFYVFCTLNGSGLVNRQTASYLIYGSFSRHVDILLAPGVASDCCSISLHRKLQPKYIPPSSCPAAATVPGKAGLFLLTAKRHVNTTETQQSKVHHLLLRVKLPKLTYLNTLPIARLFLFLIK